MFHNRIISSILIVLGFFSNVSAQYTFDWANSVGGPSYDHGHSIGTDSLGNVYSTGSFSGTADFDPGVAVFNMTSNGDRDVFIQKCDAAGNFIWAKKVGGIEQEQTWTIAVDPAGNSHIVGMFKQTVDFDPGIGVMNFTSAGQDDVFILKLNSTGDLEWAKQIASPSSITANEITIDTASNVFIIGNFRNTVDFDPNAGVLNLTASGSADVFVQKLDGSGNLVWAKQMGGSSLETGNSIDVDVYGNVYSAGLFNGVTDFDGTMMTSNGSLDVFVQKLDGSGSLEWVKQIGGAEQDAVYNMDVDVDGNVLVTGDYRSTVDFDPGVGVLNSTSSGGRDMYIMKLDSLGNLLWANQFGDTGSDAGYSVTTDLSSNVIVSGFFNGTIDLDSGVGVAHLTENSSGSGDMFIAKYDPDGIFLWGEKVGGNGFENGHELVSDRNDNILITGQFQSTVDFDHSSGVTNLVSNGNTDIFVHKLRACSSSTSTDTHVVCDSLVWIDGNTYTSSNDTATFVLMNMTGCDSIVTLDLTVNYSTTGTDVQTACDTFIWIDGNTYTSSNDTATFVLMNTAGCDSIVTLDLTVNYSTTVTDVQVACDSFTWIDGITYMSSNNTASWILTNSDGCDSIITLDLTINYSNTGTDVQTACNSFVWIDGNMYTSSNSTATWTLTNSLGCDSVVTLDLTVLSSNSGTDVQTACDSFSWIDGNIYTSSNDTATWTLTNSEGCDSVVSLDLTILYSNTGVDVQTACDSFVWIDGNTYTSSNNTATWTMTNSLGCDSVVTLDLTIAPGPNVNVIQSGALLTVDQSGANYQWLDCDDDNNIIVGATNQTYTSTVVAGNYAVEVDLNGCVDTSMCYLVDFTEISELYRDKLSLSPNPASEMIVINGLKEVLGLQSIQVVSSIGKLQFTVDENTNQVNVSKLNTGIYFVQVLHNQGIEILRFVKN